MKRNTMRLLIIEDNHSLLANLFEYFEARGHVLDAAPDGVTGLHLALTQSFDAIVLDLSLPRMDGAEVLARLRSQEESSVPILLLTARDQLSDKVAGFRAGADDYLTKPFALPELELRLEALVRRSGASNRSHHRLQVSDLVLDLRTLEAERAGQTVHLYPACRRLLQTLMQSSPAAVPRQQLEQAIWGDDPPDGDMLRSHIYELRLAVDGPFENKLIHTLPRIGYRLADLAPGKDS